MRVLIYSLLVLCASMATACQPDAQATIDSPTVAGAGAFSVTTPVISQAEDHVVVGAGNFSVVVPKPADWESFSTEYGVVMAEAFGSVATGGMLEGVMTYIFTSPLDDFETSPVTAVTTGQTNRAYRIQTQIVADVDYIGSARVTPPTAFRWDDYDASYYLLYDADLDIYTAVIGVVVENSQVLLTCTVSVPASQADGLRGLIPRLLDGIRINGTPLNNAALNQLPDPLTLPQ